MQNYDRANNDIWNLSKSLGSTMRVDVDIDSFEPVQNRNDLGLTPTELDMNAEHFLHRQRCRAEANLIKAGIAYKVHHDIALSSNETIYLNEWMKLSKNEETLLAQADILVPGNPSKLTLADALSPEDFYTLNSLNRVSINGSQRDEIALNDLVLELSHFIDPQTIRNIELSMLEQSLRDTWDLQQDFKLVERRNKEIDLVMRQMEELSWRTADMFSDREME